MIRVAKLSVGYGHRPILQNLKAELPAGKLCLLVGDNGVGKSTLLKTLLRHIPPVSGDIILQDRPLQSYRASELALLMTPVFSRSDISAKFTTWDLLAFGRFVHYPMYYQLTAEDHRRVDAVMEYLNLTHYRDFLLSELSDGNLQKAFIGRALVQDTPMILLDEPTTHLDASNRQMILQILSDLVTNQQKTILFTSHDWQAALPYAQLLWFVHDGHGDFGITEDVLLRHQNYFSEQNHSVPDGYRAPQISSDEYSRKLLERFLQKNIPIDWSCYHFECADGLWTVIYSGKKHTFTTFAELSAILPVL